MCEIVINELISELFAENKRLLSELTFISQSNKFLENYRNCLLNFKCNCNQELNNKVLIESLESQYKTIITDGCAQHSTQTTTTHNWPLDTQTTPVGHRSETITTEDQSMTAEDTGSDGCVDNTNEKTTHIFNEIKKDKEDKDWSPLSMMKYSLYNKPKRQRLQQTARKSCVSTAPKISKVYQSETSPSVSAPPKTSLYVCDYYGCVKTFKAKCLLEYHRRLEHNEISIKSDNKPKTIKMRTLKPFACDYDNCNFRAVNQLILDRHRENHERDDTNDMAIPGPPYGCQWPDCTKTFTTTWKLKRHMDQVHTGVRPFECHDCPKRFVTNSELCLHRRQKHSLEPFVPKKEFKCDFKDCQFETIGLGALNDHKKRHLNIKEFVCEETDCGMSFVTKGDLRKHMRRHSDERPHRCDWPGCESAYKKAESLVEHRRRHTGDLPFACDDCEERFPSNNSLTEHRRKRHNISRYECDVSGCSWTTNSRTESDAHRRKHQNVRPFVCEETDCGKSFSRKDSFNKHMQCHSEERPYRCDWPGCESAYKRNTSLVDHRRTHTGEREYKCPFAGCGKSYATRSILHLHKNTHKQPYVCHWPECDQRFGDNRRLQGHMNEHQGIRPHKCHFSGCDKSYFSKPSLNQHLKAVHKMVLS